MFKQRPDIKSRSGISVTFATTDALLIRYGTKTCKIITLDLLYTLFIVFFALIYDLRLLISICSSSYFFTQTIH